MTDAIRRLAASIGSGDRRALARAITLVESTRPDHRAEAAALLDALLPSTGHAVRVGISGAPGSGKSTFIDALGTWLTGQGHQVAVLAVDPSSTRSGGSILGDKTRMADLARDPRAYIRPSPSGGTLGGVALRTREAMTVCEAAGFDVVLVETVGVGQSETAVNDMVDCFVLLAAPGGGDDLQGIKRGIMELADIIVVTKADGELAGLARHAVADYRSAIHLLRRKRSKWEPPVIPASSLTGTGIDDVWSAVSDYRRLLVDEDLLRGLRAGQARAWLWSEIDEGLRRHFTRDPEVARLLAELEPAVAAGTTSPAAAAHQLLEKLGSVST